MAEPKPSKAATGVRKTFDLTDKGIQILIFGWSSLLCATTALGNAPYAAIFFGVIALGCLLTVFDLI